MWRAHKKYTPAKIIDRVIEGRIKCFHWDIVPEDQASARGLRRHHIRCLEVTLFDQPHEHGVFHGVLVHGIVDHLACTIRRYILTPTTTHHWVIKLAAVLVPVAAGADMCTYLLHKITSITCNTLDLTTWPFCHKMIEILLLGSYIRISTRRTLACKLDCSIFVSLKYLINDRLMDWRMTGRVCIDAQWPYLLV